MTNCGCGDTEYNLANKTRTVKNSLILLWKQGQVIWNVRFWGEFQIRRISKVSFHVMVQSILTLFAFHFIFLLDLQQYPSMNFQELDPKSSQSEQVDFAYPSVHAPKLSCLCDVRVSPRRLNAQTDKCEGSKITTIRWLYGIFMQLRKRLQKPDELRL